MWLCQCDCGKKVEASQASLRSGHQVSCGCKKQKHGDAGKARAPEYFTWQAMWSRCTNPKSRDYERYGARGIAVCDRWKDYRAFLTDVGRKPGPDYSIDRIENNKGYEPGNVRWATRQRQGRNRRTTVQLTFLGRTQSLADWADQLGFNRLTIWHRLKNGWSVAEALTRPVKDQKGSGKYALL